MAKSILLLPFLFSLALGGTLPSWDLTVRGVSASTAEREDIGGVVPPGWRDDSAWADVRVQYSQGQFEGTRFTTIHIPEIRQGQVQFVTPFPHDLPRGPVRFTFRGRASSPVTVTFSVRDKGPPYRTWWSEQLRVGGHFSDEAFEFEAAPLPRPVYFMININTPVTLDIADISFERGAVRIADDTTRVNLLRNSRLPLGLQPPMRVSRYFSEGTHFVMEPDHRTEHRGPSGFPSLRMQSEREFHWDGELMRLHNRSVPHTFSLYAKGSGLLRVQAMERGTQLAERVMRVRSGEDWQRAELTFQPLTAGQNHYVRFYARGEVWIDGLMVNEGEEAVPFEPAYDAEVALALPESAASIAGIQFEDEPATLQFLATGDLPPGCYIEATVTNAEGQSATLPVIPLDGTDGMVAGAMDFAIWPEKPLGIFRIEARVLDEAGAPLSEWNEIVVARLKQPRHWGAFAPESPFGTHVRPNIRHITMAKAIGNNWVRLHNDGNHITAWALLEPEEGDWRWADEDLQRYRDAHLEILGMLETAPAWASKWGLTERGSVPGARPGYFEMFFQPRSTDLYAAYVRALVERYRDDIRAYEVWNEPWQVRWFGTHYVEVEGRPRIATSENPQRDYVALQEAAYEVVKSIDPAILVLGFNTTSTSESRPGPEGVFSGPEWTAGVMAKGAENSADIASFHHYTADLSGFPDDDVTRAVRTALGPNPLVPERTALPVWMSEGSSTVGGQVRHGLYHRVLPYRNAEDTLRLVESVLRYDVAMLANGVDKIFLYSMGDLDVQGSPGSYRSLVNSDGSLHPSAAGRATLAWHIEGLRFERMLRLKEGVYAYVFGNERRSVAVICPRIGHGVFPLPETQDGLVARDLFANILPPGTAVRDQSIFVSLNEPANALTALLQEGRRR